MHEAARVVIRINQNFGIIDAYIQGSGGQKIAEQLLKNSPAGVDVFALKVPRYIKYFDLRKNDWPAAMFGLDVSNNPQDIGSYAAGHWEPIYSRLMQSGLPLTTKLEGEE
jgi:hypothetical protein